MKAAILTELNKPLTIADIEVPSLNYGQVLVDIHASGICGSQLGEIEGRKGPDKYLPHLLGHEGGGVVRGIGPGVTNVQAGDHVVLHWRAGVGIQSAPPKYKLNGETINAGWVTTFQEQAVVSENRCTKIPKDIDFEIAALYGCALTTGFGVINNDAQIKPGESVLILGAGGVGAAQVIAARAVSAHPIIVMDQHQNKLDLIKQFGATHTINCTKMDFVSACQEILNGVPLDAVIDNTGNISVMEKGYALCGDSGRMVLVGVPQANEKMSISTLPLHFNKKLIGSHGGNANPSHDIPRLLKLQHSGAYDPYHMITHWHSLGDINTAVDILRSGQAMRCTIKMV